MNDLNNDIKTLKDIIVNRETYIRFSPLGTGIVGILFIAYYFFSNKITILSQENTFFILGILSVFLSTFSSLYNSYKRGENSLPKSIRNIILNLIIVWITYFVIIFSLKDINIQLIKSYSLIFYGLLIILSRYNINSFIKNFGILSFILGIIGTIFLKDYIDEIILLTLGIGHVIIGVLLKINNK